MTTKTSENRCHHCRGVQYVLAYWFEKELERRRIHMTEIPSDVFKLIPVDCLFLCHCHVLVSYIRRNEEIRCNECDGTTWRFTEPAELEGYRYRKVGDLSIHEITLLPCEYFERCPCGDEERSPKNPERKMVLRDVLDLLEVNFPLPRFSF